MLNETFSVIFKHRASVALKTPFSTAAAANAKESQGLLVQS